MKTDTMKTLLLATGMLAAAAATTHGAIVQGVTYTYDNLSELNNFVGKDAPAGTPQALTDGLGKSGVYTPTDFFWQAGQEGSIYNHVTSNIGTLLQPSVTFDLGATIDLALVAIHYGVYQPSGIPAPASVDVTVGGNFVGNFGGFDNSAAGGFGEIRLNLIDLTGQTGRFVTLDFIGNPDTTGFGDPNSGDAWVGLTEVEFSAIPEPGSALLLGLGSLGFFLRRRR